MALGNLATRVLSAVVLLPPLLYAIYQDHSPHIVWGIVLVASVICMAEALAFKLEDPTDRRASLIIGSAACSFFYWLPDSPMASPAFVALFVAVVPTALYYLFRFGDIASVFDRLNASILAIVYGGLLITILAIIKRDFKSGDFIVLILCTAWLSDTGGYFAGKYLGKRKLYPAVSPKKTWAGSVGGVISVLIGAAVLKHFRLPSLSWLDLVLLCGPGAVLGQMGDLVESLMKRSSGVKDSGAILPGHGGLLDRVDAVLFIAPYFYVYMTISTLVRAKM